MCDVYALYNVYSIICLFHLKLKYLYVIEYVITIVKQQSVSKPSHSPSEKEQLSSVYKDGQLGILSR